MVNYIDAFIVLVALKHNAKIVRMCFDVKKHDKK